MNNGMHGQAVAAEPGSGGHTQSQSGPVSARDGGLQDVRTETQALNHALNVSPGHPPPLYSPVKD